MMRLKKNVLVLKLDPMVWVEDLEQEKVMVLLEDLGMLNN